MSLDVHHDGSQLWVAAFAVLSVLGLLTSLFVPRRRVWVKVVRNGTGGTRDGGPDDDDTRAGDGRDPGFTLEYAGLARGEDPNLERAVEDIAKRHVSVLGVRITP